MVSGADSPLSPLLNRLGLGNTPESEGQGIINRIIALVTDQSRPSNDTNEDRPSLRTAMPLAELPVVDNYRWNRLASESVPLAILCWWFVMALLGWVTWPFAFWIFRPLRDPRLSAESGTRLVARRVAAGGWPALTLP
ncbi:MAG: hypothetical protein R2867_32160 [Caldilineaceae bacterium]